MDFEEFISDITTSVLNISQQYGTGQIVIDLLLVLFALCLVVLVIGLFTLSRNSERNSQDRSNRYDGIGGRVEKLEMSMNGLRTEAMRSIEGLRSEVSGLRSQLFAMRDQFTPGWAPHQRSGSMPRPLEIPPEIEHRSEVQEIPVFDAPIPEPAPSVQPHSAPLVEVEARSSLSSRLVKARSGFLSKLKGLFSRQVKIDSSMLADLEALLVEADVGIRAAQELVGGLQEEVSSSEDVNSDEIISLLKLRVLRILEEDAPLSIAIRPERRPDGPMVVLMVGVNGVGKTTTTAKLASIWAGQGHKVLLVAADTFRAAAVEQLKGWGERLGLPVASGAPDAKPQTVVFDAMEQARRDNFDIVMIDTAGRLHTKSNLMQELESVRTTLTKIQPSAPHEVLLVVDGTTGQNALQQAQEFNEALALTGIVVTKLDGTPKGGITIAIKKELNIPVRYIGVGEAAKDLRVFDPGEFVDALFNSEGLNLGAGEPSAHAEQRIARRKRRE